TEMVAPLRDTPGNTERPWAMPTIRAPQGVSNGASPDLANLVDNSNKVVVKKPSPKAVGDSVKRSTGPRRSNPMMPVGSDAMTTTSASRPPLVLTKRLG